nr:hypothetical protein [Candidatus Freyarchaeota archaeon]
MEKIWMVLVISMVIIFLLVVPFTALLVAAGTIQLHMAAAGIDLVGFAGDPPLGIFNYFIMTRLLTSMLGPPLREAVALLDLINPNWWLNNYVAWWLVFALT